MKAFLTVLIFVDASDLASGTINVNTFQDWSVAKTPEDAYAGAMHAARMRGMFAIGQQLVPTGELPVVEVPEFILRVRECAKETEWVN